MALGISPNIRSIVRDEQDEQIAILDITGIPTTLANGIRREILSSVRTVAMVTEPPEMASIRIQENTSRLNNQFLSLRISLIPVHILPPTAGHGAESSFTERYEVRLDAEATAETGDIEVTSTDLRLFDKKTGTFLPPDVNRKVFPYDPIPIVPLRAPRGSTQGEVLRVIAGLVVGKGSDHACFSPTCGTRYEMVLDDDAIAAALEQAVDENEVRGTPREDGFRAAFQRTTALRYVKRDANGDPVGVRFHVESVGQMDPVYIFREGVIALATRARAAMAEVSTLYSNRGLLEGDTKTIRSIRLELVIGNDEANDEYLIRFRDEDHTLGALLQDIVLRKAKADDPDNYSKWFVGYRIPHPLTPVMVMRFHREGLTIQDLVEGYLIPSLKTMEDVCTAVARQVSRLTEIPPHPSMGLFGQVAAAEAEAATATEADAGAAAAAPAAALA